MAENVELVVGKRCASGTGMVRAAISIMDPEGYMAGLADHAKPGMCLVLWTLAHMGYGRVRVSSCRRSIDVQRRLYGLGRTAARCIWMGVPGEYGRPDEEQVTWCRPEDSRHVRGEAMDVSFEAYEAFPWHVVARVAALCGVDNGGAWPQRDGGHFEV